MRSKPIRLYTQDEAQLELKELSTRALLEGDLEIVFGRGSHRGKKATGNYSLLAKATGIAKQHVGQVLSGKARFSLRSLETISDLTGIPIASILGYIESKRESLPKAA